MKIDYNKQMEDIIEKLTYKPKLLLHSCCAPCSSSVLLRLINYFDITVLYYNPNIEPIEEYLKRKEEQKKLITIYNQNYKANIKLLDCDYDNSKFHDMAKGLEDVKEGGIRCFKCYRMRLEYTAQKAKEHNSDYFTTTLSISPYKNAQKLNEIGLQLQDEYHITYLVADFKKKNGYQNSIAMSHKYHLYRQNYCGCIYSMVKLSSNNQEIEMVVNVK